jgi:hypothetical protein
MPKQHVQPHLDQINAGVALGKFLIALRPGEFGVTGGVIALEIGNPGAALGNGPIADVALQIAPLQPLDGCPLLCVISRCGFARIIQGGEGATKHSFAFGELTLEAGDLAIALGQVEMHILAHPPSHGFEQELALGLEVAANPRIPPLRRCGIHLVKVAQDVRVSAGDVCIYGAQNNPVSGGGGRWRIILVIPISDTHGAFFSHVAHPYWVAIAGHEPIVLAADGVDLGTKIRIHRSHHVTLVTNCAWPAARNP